MARLSEPSRRRVLITGLSTQLGGRLAQALERDRDIEAVIGVDTDDPRHELRRTEFVRVDMTCRRLERVIAAANIDTVLDTRLLADPLLAPASHIHEVDVVGTQQLLAACSQTDSTVRRLVFKSSAHAYGWDPGAPAFITEDVMSGAPLRTGLEREIIAAESAVSAFAARRPQCRVATLRLADELGGEGRTSLTALLSLPAIPAILGFDPRWQVIHLDDAVGVLAHAAKADLDGVYNAAGDGVLVLSEIASLLGRPLLPVLPPWGTAVAAAALRPLGLKMPAEMLRALRYGRGLDNRRLKATGFTYAYTTREAVMRLRAEQRARPLLASGHGPLIDLIHSLEPEALELLRAHEREHGRRAAVLEALEDALARQAPPG